LYIELGSPIEIYLLPMTTIWTIMSILNIFPASITLLVKDRPVPLRPIFTNHFASNWYWF